MFFYDFIVEKDYIQIKRPWGIGKTSFASKTLLDTHKISQKRRGSHIYTQHHHAIIKIFLLAKSKGRIFQKGGNLQKFHPLIMFQKMDQVRYASFDVSDVAAHSHEGFISAGALLFVSAKQVFVFKKYQTL
jgi:hypothetical protein